MIVSDELKAEVLALANTRGRFLEAIKLLRERAMRFEGRQIGLKVAKDTVEKWMRDQHVKPAAGFWSKDAAGNWQPPAARQDGFRCLAQVQFEDALLPVWVDVTWSCEKFGDPGNNVERGFWIETAGGNSVEHPILRFAPLPEGS